VIVAVQVRHNKIGSSRPLFAAQVLLRVVECVLHTGPTVGIGRQCGDVRLKRTSEWPEVHGLRLKGIVHSAVKAANHVGRFFGQVIVVSQRIMIVSVAGIQVG
jgi:hypothetical protein